MIQRLLIIIFCIILSACNGNDEHHSNSHLNDVVEIAVMMPLSQNSNQLGDEYSKLIHAGLTQNLLSDIHITNYDVHTPEQAIFAMQRIIQARTKIIIGPLTSAITDAVANIAKQHNIILISFSNNPALAGDNIFIFGHAPMKQTSFIIDHYIKLQHQNFILLLPSNPSGKSLGQSLQNIINSKGGIISKIEYYHPTPESIEQAVYNIYNVVENLDPSLSKPVIYISGESNELELIAHSFNKRKLDFKAFVIGDNKINIHYPVIFNYYFTGSLNYLNTNFMNLVSEMNIYYPTYMHLMAYDAGRLIASCLNSEFNQQNFLDKLKSSQGHLTTSGKIIFIDNIAVRDYHIIHHLNNQLTTIH